MRTFCGVLAYPGTRIAAVRLPTEYASRTGASNPGTSRLYEFVEGLANADRARPWASRPPT